LKKPFFKLNSVIINKLKISKIEIQDNKSINNSIDGFFLFTSEFINTLNDKIV